MKRRLTLAFTLAVLVAGAVWVATIVAPSAPLPAEVMADRILVEKSQRRMTLFRDGKPLKIYIVSLGRGEPGPKLQEGDNRTPIGRYHISGRNPQSIAYLSLRISYPDAGDLKSAKQRGVKVGGDVMIHGLPNGKGWIGGFHRLTDWTAGCVAVTNAEMDEVWRAVPTGTPIEIVP